MALAKPMLPLQTLISFIALFAMLNKVHSQTSFTVDFFYPNPSDLTYQGDAHVPSGSTILRLTRTDASGNPQTNTVGRVLYSNPVQFWDESPARQASFETTIRFTITPPANGDAADGLAFFIAPVGTTVPSGSSGANLGIFGSSGTSSNVFAVEFDIYVNGEWDPSYRHIGIDVESRRSRNVTRFEGTLGQEVTARINYEANTRAISVVATSAAGTFTVTDVFDLKSILPQQVQVGIAASSGLEVAIQDVRSWYFSSTLVRENNVENEEPHIQQYV